MEKNDYQQKFAALNREFESKVRLGIMSVLMVNESVDFSTLKSLLGLTDGNLASHIRALEELGYLQTEKRFIGRRPNTSYSVTKAGSKAFRQHLQAMEDFFKSAPSV